MSKQTKLFSLIGAACLASALIWQNYSHVVFELTHRSSEIRIGRGTGAWDLSSLHVHHPTPSDLLFLLGLFGLLFGLVSVVYDIKASRGFK